jgi:hypothetical protein
LRRLKKAEEELINFAKPLLLRFAKAEEERKGLEMFLTVPTSPLENKS